MLSRAAISIGAAASAAGRHLHTKLRDQLSWPSASLTVERADTLPSPWYTTPDVLDAERKHVFDASWQYAGHTSQLQRPGDYLTGSVHDAKYVVCMDESGDIAAFHNVCRHHAAAVAQGCGTTSSFVCPYHGWTYGLDGRLRKATRTKGIQGFRAREQGLHPIHLATLGPLIFISLSPAAQQLPGPHEWFGPAAAAALEEGVADPLVHVASREYRLPCNWKVFCDNYLDGGYHVEHAHKNLAAGLELDSYSIEVADRVSLQRCAAQPHAAGSSGSEGAAADDRLVGRPAVYAFLYPNLMINRYGPWMDTNLVLPLTHDSCLVKFDYFLDDANADDQHFITSSLAASDEVQQEDIALCTAVQAGFRSPAYVSGRYAPSVEAPMFRFHQLVYDAVMNCSAGDGNLMHSGHH